MTFTADTAALRGRWARRDHFVILDAHFGQGAGFLSTWAAWRADQARCKRLVYIALGACDNLKGALQGGQSAHPALGRQLADRLPVPTPGLHTLSLDEGRDGTVSLLLGIGLPDDLVPQLVAQVDAFDLSRLPHQAKPSSGPHGDQGWRSRLARLAAPDSIALTRNDDPALMEGLHQSGFAPAPPSACWHFKPRHTPARLAGGLWANPLSPAHRHALVIGAGLAGCSAAWALARQGWRITLVDALEAPARAASGNPGGLFHSIVHGEDGIHARAHRAAALRTAALIRPWLDQHRLAGQCQGLLRLDRTMTTDQARALARRLDLPPEHVEWLGQRETEAASGLVVPSGGWLFHQGGWLDPSAYARTMLEEAAAWADLSFQPGKRVRRLHRSAGGEGARWQALDSEGEVIAEAPVLVLASAVDTAELIQTLPQASALPLQSVRGQLSSLPLEAAGLKAPHIPVAGRGYVLPACQGRMVFGATSQAGDMDGTLRAQDHGLNLQQAEELGCLRNEPGLPALPEGIEGRVGWRATSPDRLPYIGPLPLVPAAGLAGQRAPRTDQPRFVPRLRDEHGGVYIITGFGSRGITWAALAGELLASWVTGSPSPVEAPLRDALDPARIVTRAKARKTSG